MAKSHVQTTDLASYKLLHILGKLCAIIPNFHINSLDQRHAPNYFYAVIILLALCGLFAFSVYGKFQYLSNYFAASVFLMQIASDTVVILTNIVTILRVNIHKGRMVSGMLKRLMEVDKELRAIDEKSVTYPWRAFMVEFVVVLIFFALFVFFNIFTWMNLVGWTIYRYFCVREIQNFQVLITAALLAAYPCAIQNRVRILKRILKRLHPRHRNTVKLFATISCLRTVRKLRKVFVVLMHTMDDYNKIFGPVHLILYVNVVVTLLDPINLMLVYGMGDREFPAGTFDFHMVMLCFVWAGLPIITANLIFASCDGCIAEIRRIPNICNGIAQEFEEDNEVSGQLEQFAQQVANCQPEFSAAGFYSVNFNIYFMLLGSITTYMIVLIQFRSS